ncbi:hypothetical protein Tco_0435682 [Tanacetum coccineum]
MSMEALQAQEDLMKSIESFLKKFNRISFGKTPKVLLQAWDNFFEVKHAQSEEVQELLSKLVQNVKIISIESDDFDSVDTILYFPSQRSNRFNVDYPNSENTTIDVDGRPPRSGLSSKRQENQAKEMQTDCRNGKDCAKSRPKSKNAKVRVNTEESAVKPEPELKNTIECNLNPSDGPGKPNSITMKTVKTKWALINTSAHLCAS